MTTICLHLALQLYLQLNENYVHWEGPRLHEYSTDLCLASGHGHGYFSILGVFLML